MGKKQGRTYDEKNRFVGYFNTRYSLFIRAYVYDKNMSNSDAIVQMSRAFIDQIPEQDKKRMVDNYLNDLKISP